MVGFTRKVRNLKIPRQGTLFKSEKSCVGNFIKSSVPKNLYQWLMICDNDKVGTTLGEISRLFKAPSDCQSLTFNGGITLFRTR